MLDSPPSPYKYIKIKTIENERLIRKQIFATVCLKSADLGIKLENKNRGMQKTFMQIYLFLSAKVAVAMMQMHPFAEDTDSEGTEACVISV
jgi:hypothetical protein